MARDGTGTYALPATMAVTATTASSVTVNTIMNDIAQALTDSINKDGTKAFAASQSMGNNRITSLGAAVNATDAPTYNQLQTRAAALATTVSGTVDAIVLTYTPQYTSYVTGMEIRWISAGKNTVTGPTVNVSGLGVKTVKRNPGAVALGIGDLGVAGTVVTAMYNGTDFVLTGQSSAIASAADMRAGTADRVIATDTIWAAAAAVTVSPAVTITLDFSTFINADITLNQNVTLGQPTNTKIGQAGAIRVFQDATGSRTMLFHADWKFTGASDPVLTTTANAVDIIFYQVIAANYIYASVAKNVG